MNEVVLDASAVPALLNGEPGQEHVAAVLSGALPSTVNLAEVISKLCERGAPADVAHEAVQALGMEPVAFSEGHAVVTGTLRPPTRAAGLSLGDRACPALAKERGAVAIAAQRRWDDALAATVGVEIRRIRHPA